MLVLRVTYYLIVLTCVGISVYLTYFGFLRTFQELTLPFTIVIGLLLFSADFLIQRNRESGYPIAPGIILFIIAAIFSGMSNFNYLYTNFMTRDVLVSTMRDQYAVFTTDLADTRVRLGQSPAMIEGRFLRSQVDTELDQLWEQMADPARPGCGPRCEQHIETLVSLVASPMTDLARPGTGASPDEKRAFFETVQSLIQTTLNRRPEIRAYEEIAALQTFIGERLRFFGTADDALREGAGLERLSELSEASREVERRANALLPSDHSVDHTHIDPTLGRLGEIVYSLQNAFIEAPNRAVTILSSILAMIVDVIPVAFALIAFRPGETGPKKNRRDPDVFS